MAQKRTNRAKTGRTTASKSKSSVVRPKATPNRPKVPAGPPLARGTAWLVSPTFLFVTLAGSIGLFMGAVFGSSASGSAVWGAACVLNAVMLYVAVRRSKAS